MGAMLNPSAILLLMALAITGPGVLANDAPAVGATDANADDFSLQGFGPPAAPAEDLTERRFGLELSDAYRWMENPDDAALYDWLRQQEDYTERQTAGPLRDQLTREFGQLFAEPATVEALQATERLFKDDMLKQRFRFQENDPLHRAALRVSPRERYEIIVTPANTDIQTLQIKDHSTGMLLPDLLRVKFASVIWDANETAFVYSSMRDGRLGGATDIIRRHVLGQPQTADRVLVEATQAEEYFSLSRYGSRYLLARASPEANKLSFVDLTTGDEQPIFQTRGGTLIYCASTGSKLLFVSFLDKDMGEVVAFDLANRTFATVVPAREVPIDDTSGGATLIGNDLYITYVRDSANELIRFEMASGNRQVIPLRTAGSVEIQEPDAATGEMRFSLHTYTGGPDLYGYHPQTGQVRLIQPGTRPDIALEAFKVDYVPYQGRKALIWLIKRKGVTLSPNTPIYLYGYGGFRVNILPYYNPLYLPWLRRGGVVAMVTLPGGLEYGEAWHRLGMLQNKRNVFDAFARAAKRLIARGWTQPRRLAIGGGSNGGLLAAATAYYYPTLFRATVPQVGVLDMTRFGLFTVGPTWNSEYGDRDNAKDFRFLHSISPYHNIHEGGRYPAALVMTSDQDDRVVPAHSYKFIARLQTALPGMRSLLHVAHGTGHGMLRVAEPQEKVRTAAIMWTFIMEELGVQ